jgi:NACHT, LRR and PYD domains-containing protein 3
MKRCFINLGLRYHVRNLNGEEVDEESKTRDTGHRLSKFSLAARLRVETPPPTNQVTLQTLFSPRKRSNGTSARPRRILIWGRAGIGKTTLCKKIVHDFLSNRLWNELYDRVYWLPLRRLKLLRDEIKSP